MQSAQQEWSKRSFSTLVRYLKQVPSIESHVGFGTLSNGCWWAKFTIDIEHPLAWRVIQELGHVLNYLSIDERMPTIFMPVSPPPYLNGSPKDFLSWVIESNDSSFGPSECKKWLYIRLPRPVHDLEQWNIGNADNE